MRHTLAQRRRSRRVKSVSELVGNTPLVRLRRVTRDLPAAVEVYAKLEYFNPGGSVSDRAALRMMQDAISEGRLGQGKTLLDRASVDTGVAYSMFGAEFHVPVHLVVRADTSKPGRRISEVFGTKLIDADPRNDGPSEMARDLVARDAAGKRRYFYADQYTNPANPRAHYQTTAPELWEATGGRITHLVAGLGTTGTLMGTGRRLRLLNPAVKAVAVQPEGAPEPRAADGAGNAGAPIYDESEVDALVRVSDADGRDMTQRLAREEGLLVGYGAGAAMVAALEVAKGLSHGVLVVVFPDHADLYTE